MTVKIDDNQDGSLSKWMTVKIVNIPQADLGFCLVE